MIHWSWLIIVSLLTTAVCFAWFADRTKRYMRIINTILDTLAHHNDLLSDLQSEQLGKIQKPKDMGLH
jgi:hypothetical protein